MSEGAPENDKLQPGRGAVLGDVGLVLFGTFLIAAFFGLSAVHNGTMTVYRPPFTNFQPPELTFWLGSTLLLTPGAFLVGLGLHRWLGNPLLRMWKRLCVLDGKELAAISLALVTCCAALYRLFNVVVCRGYPITSDEYAVRFGGQLLASGRATIPTWQPLEAFPHQYLSEYDGRLASFDFLGGQLTWAVAELTAMGPLLFAFIAALALPFLAWTVAQKLGPRWGLVAVAVLFFSPMGLGLSYTTHAHIQSRTILAMCLAFFVAADRTGKRVWWLALGIGLGAGFLSRPFEVGALMLPFGIYLLVGAVRRRERRGALLWVALGMLPAIALFLLHNHAVTGDPLQISRGMPDYEDPQSMGELLWLRFGKNISYNVFNLAIWFLGPLGVVLVLLGFSANRFTRLLGAGVMLHLSLALLHDDSGIHVVGPIHYSEDAVPLAILSTYGLVRVRDFVARVNLDTKRLASAFVTSLVLGLGLFSMWNALGVHRSNGIQERVYTFIEDVPETPAVVLVPAYLLLWNEEEYEIGAQIFNWRRPRPDLSDEVLILHAFDEHVDALRTQFPDRVFYRVATNPDGFVVSRLR